MTEFKHGVWYPIADCPKDECVKRIFARFVFGRKVDLHTPHDGIKILEVASLVWVDLGWYDGDLDKLVTSGEYENLENFGATHFSLLPPTPEDL